ncbi:type I-F CRISPR-associated protein Csy3 [Ferrimonas sediminicola]|uniref:Type I-F CRISPR-associated protein Csy3 n=1 Tax=Ferrimonas sediminicola TaxID=2569538 RepID=A0A4U1B8E1_9GAMM|nr:type I-F CRISPR-associated protein Csy3 [Ferrimonas sediminicola]TKB46218.1 type I-F CRISPR-associated protein Csy3 [Ferrimonas sediminicola]
MKPGKHLSYSRSLSPGKAVFFYQREGCDFVPLAIEVNKINGQKSSFSEGYDNQFKARQSETKELAYGNPHTIEACYVPPMVDELYCRFSLRVEANSLAPDRYDEPRVNRWLMRLAQAYRDHGGYQELARRYAKNILMGRWLWRNRQTMGTAIDVKTSAGSRFEIEDARGLDWYEPWPQEAERVLQGLSLEMAEALSNPRQFWFSTVTARLKTAFCQEIHPSLQFVENVDRGLPTRQLATVECADGSKAASFHAEKVGAALQMIDDWWEEEADIPLRVHEYGANRDALVALRHPVTGRDFYQHLKRTAFYIRQMRHCCQVDGSDIPAEIHYLMSVLLKGGLFQQGRA